MHYSHHTISMHYSNHTISMHYSHHTISMHYSPHGSVAGSHSMLKHSAHSSLSLNSSRAFLDTWRSSGTLPDGIWVASSRLRLSNSFDSKPSDVGHSASVPTDLLITSATVRSSAVVAVLSPYADARANALIESCNTRPVLSLASSALACR